MNHNNHNSTINIGFPLSPENRKNYQEGVDYKIEDKGGGFKQYIILSEKLKTDFKRYNGGQDFGNTIDEHEFKMPTENLEEWQKKMREKNEQERPQKDKEKILNNLNDWILGGIHSIRNLKTNQVLTHDGGTMTKYRFFLEPSDYQHDYEVVESGFDFATFQELRLAIFNNLLKNLRVGKVLIPDSKKFGRDNYQRDNFTSAEWTEIEKYLNKNTSASHGDNNQNKNNNISPIIVITIIGLIILIVGGIVVMKSQQKKVKNGSKR